MAQFGYARVSTDGQSLTAQVAELKGVGCIEIFQVKVSGAKSDRKQLARVIDRLEKGDILIVTRLDRLARSMRDLLNVLGAVADKGAGFKSLRSNCREQQDQSTFVAMASEDFFAYRWRGQRVERSRG